MKFKATIGIITILVSEVCCLIGCSSTLPGISILTKQQRLKTFADELDRSGNEYSEQLKREMLHDQTADDSLAYLLEHLGKRSKKYDKGLLYFAYSNNDSGAHAHAISAMQKRVNENPTQVLQAGRNYLWAEEMQAGSGKSHNNSSNDAKLPELSPGESPFYLMRFHDQLRERETKAYCVYPSAWRKYMFMFYIACMFDNPSIIQNVDDENLENRYEQTLRWLHEVARYSYFNKKSGCFSVDEKARQTQVPVSPEDQIIQFSGNH